MPNKVLNIINDGATHPVVLVCEHASSFIPEEFNGLGLDDRTAKSHIAWDPGASHVAHQLSKALNAVLVESTVSRLLYDCNRPPDSPTAIRGRSEIYDIPGNQNLSIAERNYRIKTFYVPFEKALAHTLASHPCKPIIITLHSFTPIYNGVQREVDIGVLHDSDQRLADALLNCANDQLLKTESPDDQFPNNQFQSVPLNIQRNEPYGPTDEVTHTLKHHAVPHQYLNVMIEIKNDLIASPTSQKSMAKYLHRWITQAIEQLTEIETSEAPGVA